MSKVLSIVKLIPNKVNPNKKGSQSKICLTINDNFEVYVLLIIEILVNTEQIM